MLQKTLSTKSIKTRKNEVKVSDNSRAGRNGRCKFGKSEIGNNKIDDEVDNEFGKKSQKRSKFKDFFKSKKLSNFKKTIKLNFFIFGTRLTFIKLR